jgi:hypothetical protein
VKNFVICSFLLVLSGWLNVEVGKAFRTNRGYKNVNKIWVRKQLLKRSLNRTKTKLKRIMLKWRLKETEG